MQLKYFLAAANTEHITKAAQQMNVAQPALSQAIHKLEKELGVDLFVHQGRNIKLTSCGKEFRDKIAPHIQGLDQAVKTTMESTSISESTITICVKAASVLVVEAMSQYAKQYPNTIFKVSNDIEFPDNDIVIRSSETKSKSKTRKETTKQHTFTEKICIALPTTDNRKEPLHLCDLRNERFICLAGSRHFRKLCDKRCLEHGFSYEPAFESDDPSVVRKMIALGLGIGFWPEYSWGTLEESGLKLVRIAEKGFERTVEMYLTEKGAKKEIASNFFEDASLKPKSKPKPKRKK